MIRPNSTPADANYGSDFPQRTRTEAFPNCSFGSDLCGEQHFAITTEPGPASLL